MWLRHRVKGHAVRPEGEGASDNGVAPRVFTRRHVCIIDKKSLDFARLTSRPWQEFREFHFEILPWLKERTISRNYPLRESTKTFVKVLRNFPLSKPQNRANRRRKGPLRREIRQLARSHGLTCPWPPQYYRLHTPYASSFVFMHDNFLFSPVFFRARFFLPQNAVRGPKSPP